MPRRTSDSFAAWGVGPHATRIKRWTRVARGVLIWEAMLRRFWPLLSLLLFFAGVVLLDVPALVPGWPHILLLVTFAMVFALLVWRGLKGWQLPGELVAQRRLEEDGDLYHRPLESLRDKLVTGQGDRLSEAFWRLHRARALESLTRLRVKLPQPQLARQDRWALTGLALLFFLFALAVGSGEMEQRIARAFSPNLALAAQETAKLDAWINPPDYSGMAPVFLTDETPRPLTVVAGSRLLARLQGAREAEVSLDETVSAFERLGRNALKVELAIAVGDQLTISADGNELGSWMLDVQPDLPPSAGFLKRPNKTERLSLRLDYKARDDFGLTTMTAEIRRVAAPDDPPIELDLFLDNRNRTDVRGSSYHDLTAHPWAGLAAEITLIARDALGQEGRSRTERALLPERIFEHPVAKALIELRRAMTLEPNNRVTFNTRLEELANQPDAYGHDTLVALAIFSSGRRLIHDRSPEAVPAVQQTLWDTALHLEDGEVGIAERDLRLIQQALMEALANGAEDSEIERLLDELQAALDLFLEALADQMRADLQNQGNLPPPGEQGRRIESQELRELIEKARELARSGARDAAEQLLAQLQNILENLRAGAFPEGQPDQLNDAHRMMSEMEQLLNQQQDLLDRSYRRSQPGDAQQPGELEPGQADANRMDAESQEALRRQLGELMQQLGEMMGDMPPALGRAEQEMRAARDALRQNQPGKAVRPQGRSLDQMQQGMQAMAENFMRMFDRLQEQGAGDVGGRPGDGAGTDPLGRESGRGGQFARDGTELPGVGELLRSREILDELRRRRSDRERPGFELDYLDRLLRQF